MNSLRRSRLRRPYRCKPTVYCNKSRDTVDQRYSTWKTNSIDMTIETL